VNPEAWTRYYRPMLHPTECSWAYRPEYQAQGLVLQVLVLGTRPRARYSRYWYLVPGLGFGTPGTGWYLVPGLWLSTPGAGTWYQA